MDNLNILAALAGALLRCRPLAWNGHAARPASCIASRQHTHNCPSYLWTGSKQYNFWPIGGARHAPYNSAMSSQESQHKGKTGLRRLFNAAAYSWAGLCAAFRHEAAFRLDVLLFVVFIPLAFVLEADAIRRALLIAPLFLILIVELLNSAIEAAVDRVSLENHHLAKRAKDIGSAAVLLSLASAFTIWLLVLTG